MRSAALAAIASVALVATTLGTASDPGHGPRAWLGVVVAPESGSGVRVLGVVPDGPAAKAGIARGDLLVRVAGAPWPGEGDAAAWLGRVRPGERVEVGLVREGVERAVFVVAGSREDRVGASLVWGARGPAASALRSGFVPIAIPDALRGSLGAPAGQGVLLGAVEPRSAADRAGLRAGDVLIRCGGRAVATPSELYEALEAASGGAVPVEVLRDADLRRIVLETAPAVPPGTGFEVGAAGELRARRLRGEIEDLRRRIERLELELEALERED